MTEKINDRITTNKSEPEETNSGSEIFFPEDHAFNRWATVILGGLIILGTALFSGLQILNTYTAITRHGRAVLLDKLPLIFLVIAIGLPIGILLILWAKNHWDDQLIIHKNGFSQQKGTQKKNWYWQQTEKLDTAITSIQFGGSIVSTKVKLRLEDSNGGSLVIRNNYQRMSDLIDRVRSNILPKLYEKAIDKLDQNEIINFHPQLIATQNGLQINDQLTPWEFLADPISKNNKLILKSMGEKEILFKSNIKQIENLDLLLCLLDNFPKDEN